MVPIIRYRKFYYAFSAVLVTLSIAALLMWGLKFGIDFKGGSLLVGEFETTVLTGQEISEIAQSINLGEIVVQPTGEKGVLLRFRDVDEQTHQQVIAALNEFAQEQNPENMFTQRSFESIGPSIGKELRTKALTATAIVLALIIGYIALAFRKISYPLSSWKYGIATLIALSHDVIIPLGLFAVLGRFYNVEISSAFIAAILTVLGYSVHDSIIVFDRVRENLLRHHGETFDETVNISVNQTFVRSLNTSLTVILVLLAIYFFGGESIKYLALMLLVGIGVGTYSSIFIASTILVSWYDRMMGQKAR
ncbi:MAG: protein translocase subunit SecF [Candidatus Azambacteria bacterium]|nr:protein translocase subunit SecF [Candidatus Azambacteria bacterium]